MKPQTENNDKNKLTRNHHSRLHRRPF